MTTIYQGVTPAPASVTAVDSAPAKGNDFYGKVIPAGYGTRKVEGANIWSSPVSTVTVGKTVKQVVDFAVSFGERSSEDNVKTSILKLMMNDQVMVDKTQDIPVHTKGFIYTTYSGSEDQTFDPTIEKWQGKGNTPAYRGQVYIVVRNFALGDFGMSDLPTISAVLSDYSVDVAKLVDWTPMAGPPHPEWQVEVPEGNNKHGVYWKGGRYISTGKLKLANGTIIKNAIREFDLNTMAEINQAAVVDSPTSTRPVGWLPGFTPHDPVQPHYSGGPLELAQTGLGGGPWIMPETGYVVTPTVDTATYSNDCAVIDPATGRMLGRVGCQVLPNLFSAAEHVFQDGLGMQTDSGASGA